MDLIGNRSKPGARILAIQKKSGERIDFPEGSPATILNSVQTEEIDRDKIANLVETAGEKIIEIITLDGIKLPVLFAKLEGGKIRYTAHNETVVGNALQIVEIDRARTAKMIKNDDGAIIEITTLDGIKHPILYAIKEGRIIRYVAKDAVCYPVSVPLNEIELIWIREVDVAASIVATTIFAPVVFGVVVIIAFITFPPHFF